MDLYEKILLRETELQRAYDAYCSEESDLLSWINQYKTELEWKESRLLWVRDQLEKCKQRAEEQGFADLL